MQNAIEYVKELEAAGLTREEAETYIRIMTQVMETDLATKRDLREAVKDLEAKIELRYHDLANKIDLTKQEMTIKLGTIVSIAIGVAVALAKLV